MPPAQRILFAPALPVIALIGAAIGWRAWYAVQFSQLLDCDHCLVAPTILNEAQPFLVLLCIAWAVGRWLPRWAVVVRIATVAALCVSWGDIAAQRAFATRLNWYEIRKFWNEADTLLDFARVLASSMPHPLLTALVALGALALVYALGRYLATTGTRVSGRGAALGAILIAASLLASEAGTHQFYVRGSLPTFWHTSTRHTPYPAGWQPPHASAPQPAQERTCHPPQTPQDIPRVILVIVESLSSYQSQGFGGIHDWTPHLDRWAQSGWKFNHFLANGKTTEDGLYALLTGRNPLPAPGLDSIYAQPLDRHATLPSLLGRHGFHTAFLTSGDLGFMHKGDWLRRVGFDEIEGHQAPFYDGHQRYHFGAAKDDVLYARALQWMSERAQGQYFLTLETVSTHQPFFDPENNRASAQGAFRYADAALDRFIRQLQSSGFLDNGLLIVTSDHRAMVPASADEKERLGPRHLSRTPLLLLGRGIAPRQEATPLLPARPSALPGPAADQRTCLHREMARFFWNGQRSAARMHRVLQIPGTRPRFFAMRAQGR